MNGRNVGIYRLVEKIGSGGMGEVWKAEDTRLLRSVALKILPAEMIRDTVARQRFLHEARIAAQLYHPNIATIHAVEEFEERPCIVMEWVDGPSLATAIARRTLNEEQIIRAGREIAAALVEAHSHGIIHRDVKPENVIVSRTGVKVLDFGIARRLGDEMDSTYPRLTQAGMIIGTPQYMSPEQTHGQRLDPRTDIYSVGAVLYECVTGRVPFQGTSVFDTMMRIVRDEPVKVSEIVPRISRSLESVIHRCLRKNRADRFSDAAELGAALAACQPGSAESLPPVPNRENVRTTPLSRVDEAQVRCRASVLVVDDDSAIRRLIGDVGHREGMRVDQASNGSEAVTLLKSNEYEMIFLDLMMPRIDGWGVMDFLRNRKKAARRPALFIITAFGDQKISPREREFVAGVIYKPFDVGEIALLMRTIAAGESVLEKTILQSSRHVLIPEFFGSA